MIDLEPYLFVIGKVQTNMIHLPTIVKKEKKKRSHPWIIKC